MIETINKANARRKIEEALIMHSDRGVQYVSKEYKRVTATMQCSCSKKAYPWDNACIESFHSLIKREWLNHFKIRDYNHATGLLVILIFTFSIPLRQLVLCQDLVQVKMSFSPS